MIKIEHYKPIYRDTIRKICADTAKGSYAIKPKKREAICNTYIDYYLDCEPQNCFVATDNGKACGYIVCSTNAELYQQKFKTIYLKKISQNNKMLGIFAGISLKVSKKLDEKYSGGFHINIDSQHQGQHIGNYLLTALGQHLQKNNVNYMYLVTKNRKTRGYGFYSHFGFKEVKKYFLGSLALAYDLKDLQAQHGYVEICD